MWNKSNLAQYTDRVFHKSLVIDIKYGTADIPIFRHLKAGLIIKVVCIGV